jgi:hypothetical protein
VNRRPTICSLHLTDTPRSHRDTVVGMAFFARTGPPETTCQECRFWDRPRYLPGGKGAAQFAFRCLKAVELAKRARRSGRLPAVPADAPSCRYFEPRGRGAGKDSAP